MKLQKRTKQRSAPLLNRENSALLDFFPQKPSASLATLPKGL